MSKFCHDACPGRQVWNFEREHVAPGSTVNIVFRPSSAKKPILELNEANHYLKWQKMAVMVILWLRGHPAIEKGLGLIRHSSI